MKQISNKGTLLKQTKKTMKWHPIVFKSLSVSSEKITTNIVFGGIWSMLLGAMGITTILILNPQIATMVINWWFLFDPKNFFSLTLNWTARQKGVEFEI